jgi:hypothetical protein
MPSLVDAGRSTARDRYDAACHRQPNTQVPGKSHLRPCIDSKRSNRAGKSLAHGGYRLLGMQQTGCRTRRELLVWGGTPAGIEPATPSLPSMRRWFMTPCGTARSRTTAQVRGTVEGCVVGWAEAASSRVLANLWHATGPHAHMELTEMVDTSDLRSLWDRMSEPRCQATEASTGDHHPAEVVKGMREEAEYGRQAGCTGAPSLR